MSNAKPLLVGVLAALLSLIGPDADADAKPVTVKIIGFNDYHGNLQSPGSFGQNTAVPSAARPLVGGADALAAHVARLKAQNPEHVVVGAGDFIGASPLISALFFDEPAVETLNRIGLEFNAVGNHEFDKGAAELLRLQRGGCKQTAGATDPNSCRGAEVGTPVPFEGAQFQWLSANVVSTATGQPLLPAYGIKRFAKGTRVAFVGMTLQGTPRIVTPSGVAGLEFRDEAATVNALVPELRKNGADAIVVLVHQGGFQSAGLSDINGCDGNLASSELARIVARLDDAVDLVISGHTHAAYNCSANTVDVRRNADGSVSSTPRPTGLPNAQGRLLPVTSASAFGRVLTDIDLDIDRKRGVVEVRATNRLVDRNDPEIAAAIEAKPAVRDLVAAYGSLVSPIANQVIGSITTALPNTADAAGNMPAGELIADSQLAATAAASFGGAQIAFMNPGGVRSPGFTFPTSGAGEGDGNVTYGEASTVQPFGNSLVTVTLGAQDLKNALEQQFAGCRGQTGQRILIPSQGLQYRWDATRGCDARVSDVRLVNGNGAVIDQIVDAQGVVLRPAQTYRVTINNFLATGGDGFTTFAAGTAALGGAQDLDALTAYLAGFRRPEFAAYDPAAAALLAALACASALAPAGAHSPAAPDSAAALARQRLLSEAEAALARGEALHANDAFQRAAQLEHAADIELGLVRSDMQAGEYRRALAFAAHVAGVHGDEPEGALAYAWLLLLGGQRAQAQRVLERALARLPQQTGLLNLQRRGQQAAAFTPTDWMTPPLRLAPYALGDVAPPGARLVASALLIDAGRQALAPAAALASADAAWLRDGLGRTVQAALLRRDVAPGLALLRLERPLDSDAGPPLAARDAFPGAPAWVLDHAADAAAAPAWPWLLPGFLGSADGDGSQRLGIALPGGSGGGPVLDAAGRLVGIALPQGSGRHALLPASALHAALGALLPVAQTPAAPRQPPDALYERGLRWTLQVLITP